MEVTKVHHIKDTRLYVPLLSLDPALKYSASEARIADMLTLFVQLDPSGTYIHSISDTFIVEAYGATILLAYTHSRLAPSSPDNLSSLRVVQFSEPSSDNVYLQFRNTVSTVWDHDIHIGRAPCMDNQIVRDNFEANTKAVFRGIKTSMENTCLDWLIALLGTLALAPNNQKGDIISVHHQYLHVLAQLEQEAALQAGYIHSPLTFLSYAKTTAEFRSVTDLLEQSIVAGNLRAQIRARWYYYDAVAKLRQDFNIRVGPALVPNYLPRGISPAVRARRLELEECDKTGNQSSVFVLPLDSKPQAFAGDRLTLKEVKMPEFS
ncbi:hypothetical protein B0H14DRAFT_2563922 [Mycena olivaceomarginata]|nr:hypothetical protein B0H14DRAFT_2563922 [Mycena olivaceomarginata]